MGRLVHTGLGSSTLVAHVLPLPPPLANSFVINRYCSNKHKPSQPFGGTQQGRRVILWESLSAGEKEKGLTELQSEATGQYGAKPSRKTRKNRRFGSTAGASSTNQCRSIGTIWRSLVSVCLVHSTPTNQCRSIGTRWCSFVRVCLVHSRSTKQCRSIGTS